MSRIDNLSRGELDDLLRRVKALEVATPLANASAGRGRVRMYDGSELLIQDSNLRVIGTAVITGTLQADGTIKLTGTLTQSGTSTFTGPTNLNGTTTVTGDFAVNGPTTVAGNFDVNGPTKLNGTTRITGKTTLENDLSVTTGGEIKVGTNMRLAPSVGGGSAVFPNGSMEGTPNGVQLANTARTRYVYASDDQAGITAGSNAFVVSSAGSYILNLPTTTVKPNLYIDTNGKVFRSTATI